MTFMALEYPITRSFQWRWIGPLSFFGAFVAIVLLAVLNTALVGYETVTVFQSDFYATQDFWYDKYMPYRSKKAGELCSEHVFNVGDRFTTNYTIFEWVIQSIEKPNAASSGVAYNGSLLTDCDVSDVYVNGDLRTWSIDFDMVISCNSSGRFDISATTSFSISSLPGIMAPMLGYSKARNSRTDGDGRAITLDRMIRTASEDIGNRTGTALTLSKGASAVLYSVQADFEPCPASKGDTDCAKQKPKFDASQASMIFSDSSLVDNTPNDTSTGLVLDAVIAAPMFNLIQTAYAAARVDLGIDSPNNFLLHLDALPMVLNKTFPATSLVPAMDSHLYTAWANISDPVTGYDYLVGHVPLNVTGPANIQVVYLCQFQRRKSPGSLIVSVLVATMSMFSTGWGIYFLLITRLAKRRADSNFCEGHAIDSASDRASPHPYGKS